MRPRRARLGCGCRFSPRRQCNHRFNEAEARAPRMPRGRHPCPCDCLAASMRPRRARLGCQEETNELLTGHGIASMRPRRARLGCERVVFGDRSVGCASMRPRRARLGCDRHGARRRPGCRRASMRPRRARLGCLPNYCLVRLALRCFNEAEARAPRMRASGNAHSASDTTLQ